MDTLYISSSTYPINLQAKLKVATSSAGNIL